jgi:thiopeptide-type bacteriocin biosynthesis protein
MRFQIISPVLVRAPLCRVDALEAKKGAKKPANLATHPLGMAAVTLASRDLGLALARGGKPAQVAAAWDRYARRAAFRATPSGLLAGVALAALGERTRLHSGPDATAHVAPAWGRLASLGRGLLDDALVRAQVQLRLCPSLLRGPDEWCWLHLGDEGLSVRGAAPDQALAALLTAAGAAWTAWPVVRRQLRVPFAQLGGGEDPPDGDDPGIDDAIDDWLLMLIDDGLITHDLTPPLVGPPAPDWMMQRLAQVTASSGAAAAAIEAARAGLAEACDCAARLDLARARAALLQLPGAAATSVDLHGVLAADLPRQARVSERAIARAAQLSPTLFRLQAALAAPAGERRLDAALLDRLSGIAEQFGAGGFDLTALATGGHGARLIEGDEPESLPAAPGAGLLGYLVDLLSTAARQATGADARKGGAIAEIALDPAVLDEVLPAADVPASFEIFLAPATEPARAAPGTGWLLGHHGPAGASFARYATALGEPLQDALAQIAAAEAEVRPGEQALDVVHAASLALADLSAHPPLRSAALALTGWPAGAAVVPADLTLVIDDAAAEPLGLRAGAGHPVAPRPLHRVRSTTVPAGLYRLLAGWSFTRQHAPWSFSWGPLADLGSLPRVVLDGFVVAPASWRLPDRETLAHPAGFARWRQHQSALGMPRWIQVGEGDELLPVDLHARGAAADLARHADGRAHEIWPPLDRLADAGGRRLEIVAAVISHPDEPGRAATAAAITAVATVGRVPSPADEPPPTDWLTFRLYGARELQDAVLFESVAPVIAQARARGDLQGWFFLRYVDPGTGRDHLRLRLRGVRAGARTSMQRLMLAAMAGARRDGLVVAVDTADYFRETARYGGPAAMDAAEVIFAAGSDLVLAVLQAEHAGALPADADRRALLVGAQDALARGFGIDRDARHALAERRRGAWAHAAGRESDDLRAEFRQRQRQLAIWLDEKPAVAAPKRTRKRAQVVPAGDGVTALLDPLCHATAAAIAGLSPADRAALTTALPALLHLQAVRLCGIQPDDEQAATFFWARTLEGLAARARRS